jgi:MarR family transcriptional regulator, transcriptional regulator for hemolysin
LKYVVHIIDITYHQHNILLEAALPTQRNPEQSLGFLLKDVSRLMRRDFERRARRIGLTQTQWQTLAHLALREGINQATLADLMEIQPITLARLIDRLEEMNLVERRPDPGDRRAVQLYLTKSAAPLIETMWDLAAETRAEALAGLPAETRQMLIEALQHIRQNLITHEGADTKKSPAS